MATKQDYLDWLGTDAARHRELSATLASGGDPVALLGPSNQIAPAPAAYCWLQSPSILRVMNTTIVGYVSDRQKVARIDSGGNVQLSTLGSVPEKDDHNQPTFHVRTDGRVLALYANHPDSRVRARVTTSTAIDAWGSETLIDMGGFDAVSYGQPVHASDLYAFARRRSGSGSGELEWVLAPITEGGTLNGNRRGVWYGDPATEHEKRPYVVQASNGSRADFFATHATGSASTTYTDRNREIYHFALDSTGWLNSAGGPLNDGIHNAARRNHGLATLVYQAAAGDTCWTLDAAYDSSGNPCVLFQLTPSLDWSDHRLYYGRWDGSAWQCSEIASIGPTISPGSSDAYSGGASFDRENSSIIYTTEHIGGVLEIVELQTADGGVTWSKTRDVTSGSTENNQRPIGSGGKVVYFGGGSYGTFTTYQTKLLRDTPGE